MRDAESLVRELDLEARQCCSGGGLFVVRHNADVFVVPSAKHTSVYGTVQSV